jgi:hypothetical protein
MAVSIALLASRAGSNLAPARPSSVRWKPPEPQSDGCDPEPEILGPLTQALCAIRDRLATERSLDAAARREVSAARRLAQRYFETAFPEIQTSAVRSSLLEEEGQARLLGRAMVKGWTGFDRPLGCASEIYYEISSPDGRITYRVEQAVSGRKQVVAIRLAVTDGVELEWGTCDPIAETEVHFTTPARNQASIILRTLLLARGKVAPAEVRYKNGTRVDHFLQAVQRTPVPKNR